MTRAERWARPTDFFALLIFESVLGFFCTLAWLLPGLRVSDGPGCTGVPEGPARRACQHPFTPRCRLTATASALR
jgi:hypothetical protein